MLFSLEDFLSSFELLLLFDCFEVDPEELGTLVMVAEEGEADKEVEGAEPEFETEAGDVFTAAATTVLLPNRTG